MDFLDEIKRATADKNSGGIDLVLHMPEKERNESHEATIRERLAGHFKKHYRLLVAERQKVLKLGLKVGDKVLFGKYAGEEVKVDEVEYKILSEEDVLAVIE